MEINDQNLDDFFFHVESCACLDIRSQSRCLGIETMFKPLGAVKVFVSNLMYVRHRIIDLWSRVYIPQCMNTNGPWIETCIFIMWSKIEVWFFVQLYEDYTNKNIQKSEFFCCIYTYYSRYGWPFQTETQDTANTNIQSIKRYPIIGFFFGRTIIGLLTSFLIVYESHGNSNIS